MKHQIKQIEHWQGHLLITFKYGNEVAQLTVMPDGTVHIPELDADSHMDEIVMERMAEDFDKEWFVE